MLQWCSSALWRRIVKTSLPVLVLCCLVASLSACAQTGQVVTLKPGQDLFESSDGEGREVAVRVVNEMEDVVLGRLENRRGEHAVITTDRDPVKVMTEATREALRSKGFQPVVWSEDAARTLTVRIRRIEHVVTGNAPRKVDTRVELAFEAGNDGRSLTGTARAGRSDTTLTRPTAERNGIWISEALDSGLDRLLGERLREFLTNP